MRPSIRSFLIVGLGLVVASCANDPTAAPHGVGAPSFSRDANAATYTTIDIPGSVMIFPADINDHGVIVGRYTLAGHTHGFIRDEAGIISTIDIPGSSFTVAGSVNDTGVVAGWYILPAAPAVRHGFILHGGIVTTVDPPGSVFTNILGINERGDLTGRYRLTANGPAHGFLYHDGEFTFVNVPGADETNPAKSTPSGIIGGEYDNIGGPGHLFVYTRGEFATFALPNGKSVSGDNGGINARGDMVGTYCATAPGACSIAPTGVHGFLLSGGEMTSIDVPGSVATAVGGINSRGDIVGVYFDAAGGAHGFLRQPGHGN
jgi:hypothetical protein